MLYSTNYIHPEFSWMTAITSCLGGPNSWPWCLTWIRQMISHVFFRFNMLLLLAWMMILHRLRIFLGGSTTSPILADWKSETWGTYTDMIWTNYAWSNKKVNVRDHPHHWKECTWCFHNVVDNDCVQLPHNFWGRHPVGEWIFIKNDDNTL